MVQSVVNEVHGLLLRHCFGLETTQDKLARYLILPHSRITS